MKNMLIINEKRNHLLRNFRLKEVVVISFYNKKYIHEQPKLELLQNKGKCRGLTEEPLSADSDLGWRHIKLSNLRS